MCFDGFQGPRAKGGGDPRARNQVWDPNKDEKLNKIGFL